MAGGVATFFYADGGRAQAPMAFTGDETVCMSKAESVVQDWLVLSAASQTGTQVPTPNLSLLACMHDVCLSPYAGDS